MTGLMHYDVSERYVLELGSPSDVQFIEYVHLGKLLAIFNGILILCKIFSEIDIDTIQMISQKPCGEGKG